MTIALRDFLNWFEGISENIEAAPTEKQWARIKERIDTLKTATVSAPVAPQMAVSAGPEPGAAGVPKPVVTADTAAILKQVEDMKRRGQASAGASGGGIAMSAGV